MATYWQPPYPVPQVPGQQPAQPQQPQGAMPTLNTFAQKPQMAATNTQFQGTSTYGAQPGQNLMNAQFNPTMSARTNQYQGMTDTAAQRYTQAGQQPAYGQAYGILSGLAGQMGQAYGAGGISPPAAAQLTQNQQQMRTMTLADLEKVRTGTDRGALAGNVYDTLAERGRPEYEQRVRELGQKTAALGRIGSGIYGSNLTDLNAERERELSLSRKELANSAAGQSLADRMDILNATRGVSGDVSQQDEALARTNAMANASYGASLGENFDQRMRLADMYAGLEDRGYSRGRDQFTTLGDYAGYQQGQDRADRGELRGERDYQYGMSRDAIGDQRYGYEAGVQADDRRYGRLMDQAYASDPTRAQMYASQNYGQSGREGMAGGADLLGDYMYRRQMGQYGQPAPDTRSVEQQISDGGWVGGIGSPGIRQPITQSSPIAAPPNYLDPADINRRLYGDQPSRPREGG